MIPKAWARALSFVIVISLLTSVYVITDFPTMDVVAVNHSGIVTQNETWRGTNNHIILGNVTIPEGITVEIEAGADVQFEDTGNTNIGLLNIFVNGTLIINGTEADPVTFTSRVQVNQKAPGQWGTIYYNATADETRSKVSHAVMEYGYEGLYLEDTSILVENVHIHNMSQEGIVVYGSSPIIRNCTLHYNNFGIWAEAGGEPLIIDNTIEWNMYDGIYAVSRVNPIIKNNLIWNNIDDGIHILAFNTGEVSNNTIIHNRDMGVVLSVRANMLVKDNNISENFDAGIWVRASGPTIHHNLITNNTRNGIRIFDCKVSQGCPKTVVANNTIAYNNKESGLYPGIFVENADPHIINNYIAFNDAEGIYLRMGSGGNISSNAIINNQIGVSLNESSTWVVNNNPISGNIAGIYVRGGEPLIRENVITNNKYGIYTYDDAQPGIYKNVISSASGKDVLLGDMEGKVSYFQNRGESVFKDLGRVRLKTGADVDVGSYANPAWGDIDNDGLDDLLVGNGPGNVHYYRNLGDGYFEDMGLLTNETPVTNIGNIIGTYCNPFITDWDEDGDTDIFCGTTLSGHIYYLTNNGDDVFTGRGRLTEGLINFLDPGSKSGPFFLDWNGDGDRDLIVGNYWGDVKYYENNGGVGNISFTYSNYLQWTDGINAYNIAGQGNDVVPWMVDWDGDTREDLITSNHTGVYLWERAIANLFNPPIQLVSSADIEINARAVDWNGDGYYDLVVGGQGGSVKYYRNDGLDNFQSMSFQDASGDMRVLPWSSPFPVDFDGDGILDLIVGADTGDVWYFKGTAPGSPIMQFVQILRGSGTPQAIRVGGMGFGMASPFSVDWDNDDLDDLIVGEINGYAWLFTNDGDETFSSVGKAYNETGKELRTNGQSSAVSVGDWDGDMLLDLVVGDSNGYVEFWKRTIVPGYTFNFTNTGRLWADGDLLKVSGNACPYADDWNADGDLDLLVGDVTGRVVYYENNGDGSLSFKGNLTNILGGDVKVSNNGCPQGVGYHGSIQGYKGGIGIYAEDSTPEIRNNVMIKGGDGNRTVGEGEMGGVGIYLLRSDAVIIDNKNISGGTGGMGLADPTMNIIGGAGGHGIYLDESTGYIYDNTIIGGLGGPGEAATSPFISIGGEGGSGLVSVNNTTTTILSNIIMAGEGGIGFDAIGPEGSGIRAMNNSQPHIEDCAIMGGIGVYSDNSTPFIVNSTIDAATMSFNATNGAHAIALNTTFDREKTYYGDDESVLEAQWFLHIKVVDRSGFPVPDTEITIERDGLSFMGHLSSAFAPLATTSGPAPTVVDWDGDGHNDIIVGENDGDVQWYKNQGDDTFQTPPVTLLRGSMTGMRNTRPYVYDLDFDGNPDVVLGDYDGNIYWYKRSGTNLVFYSHFHIVENDIVVGDVAVNQSAAPAIGDWNNDGFWDLVVCDSLGTVNVFTRHPGSFLNFSVADVARMTDGTPVRIFSPAVPNVVDWNQDSHRDLILSAAGQVRLYLSCENGTLMWGGLFYSNRSGLQPILVGGFSASAVLDFNGDGDLDLLVGATNNSLPDTGNIEYFESNRNGNTRTLMTDDKGELSWLIVTEFVESDKNGNHFGDDEGDKVYYTPHSIKARRNIDYGCASPEALMTMSREVIVTMCRDVSLPVVVKTYPVAGQQGVQINEKVKIWFSKPMNTSKTVITVKNDGPSPGTPTTSSWSDGDTQITLCLNPPLCLMEYDRHYTVSVSGGSEDKWGLHLDGNRDGIQNGPGWDDHIFSFHTDFVDNTPPVPVIDHWPPVPTFLAPVQIIFSGANSTDNKGIVWWDLTVETDAGAQPFSGSNISNATTPPLWFNSTGMYCAFLNVTDMGNNMGYVESCVNITTADVIDPVADAGPDQTIAPGQLVMFDGSGSFDDVTPLWDLNFTWTFFDGMNGQVLYGMNPTHSGFLTVGSWVVTLIVEDRAGNSDNDTMTVTVEFDPRPIADAGPPIKACAGEAVLLDASGTTDNNPLVEITFNWTFNDVTGPILLQGMMVLHQFNVSGDFEITLNATDISGGWDVDTTWVNVTTCYKPTVLESGPVGPDKLANAMIWARFSKDMKQPDLTFSFTLREDVPGSPVVVGNAAYDQATRNFTFTPFADLDYSTTYRACFNASIAVDTEGFYLDGNDNNVSEMHPVDTFCWTFRTANTPSVGLTDPFAGEMNVPVKKSIKIAFNEPMDPASVESAFSMTDGFTIWDDASFIVGWDAQMLVATFSNFPFEFNRGYEVTLDASIAHSGKGVYLDSNMDGFPMGSPIDDYVWSFSTEPTPKVLGVPTGSGIPLDSNIVLSFNKIMNWTSVKSALTIKEDGAIVPIDSFGVTSFDNMALRFTVDPFSLGNGIPYNITLSGDLISGAKDLNGNSLDGNKNDILESSPIDDYSWEFLTVAEDEVPPQVISNYPADGTTGVQLDEKMTVTFSEQIDEVTFVTGIVARVNQSAFPLEPFAEYVWNTSSRTLTLIPNGGLIYDTQYTIIVSGSIFDGVRDLAGNTLDGDKDGTSEGSPEDDHSFKFKTPDPYPPYIVNTTPYSDETGVLQDTDITARFDDVMDESTLDNFDVRDGLGEPVDGNLTYDSQLRTLLFNPDDYLRPGMTYTITVSNASDADGNPMAAPYSWSFTTRLDTLPPVVTITYPAEGFETTVGDEVIISGTAYDDSGIESLYIQFGDEPQADITSNYDSLNHTWSYIWDTGEYGSGQVTINVTAHDLLLLRGSDQVSIQINEKPTEDITWLILVILAVVMAVVATLLFLFMWRRRRRAVEDEVIAEEVTKEMAEEREAEEKESVVGEEIEEAEGVSEPIEIEETEVVKDKEKPAPKLKKPVRRMKK